MNLARAAECCAIAWASAAQVPRLMADFDRDILRTETPCAGMDLGRLATTLARVHAELILIHPFREGNGRCARLLALLMAMQAGLPTLDFWGIQRQGQAALRGGDPRGGRARLCPARGLLQRRDQPDLRGFRGEGLTVRLWSAYGRRMPSTADELAAATRSARARTAGLRSQMFCSRRELMRSIQSDDLRGDCSDSTLAVPPPTI